MNIRGHTSVIGYTSDSLMLHAVNDLLLEYLSLFEDLLHSHTGNDDTRLSLDDALDNVLNMVAFRWHDGSAPAITGAIWVAGQKERIFLESVEVIVRTDGKNCRQGKLKLLIGHSLKVEREIEGRDGDPGTFLPWFDECFLDNTNVVNSRAGEDKILVWLRDRIPHAPCHCEGLGESSLWKSAFLREMVGILMVCGMKNSMADEEYYFYITKLQDEDLSEGIAHTRTGPTGGPLIAVLQQSQARQYFDDDSLGQLKMEGDAG
jgi:hypothetical protein